MRSVRGAWTPVAIWLLATLPCATAAGHPLDDAPVPPAVKTLDQIDLNDVKFASAIEEVSSNACQPERRVWAPSDICPVVLIFSQSVGRVGWWTTAVQGSTAMIGEYQDLQSSPFWDFDHLCTDGTRTDEFFATGTDLEGMQVGMRHTGPGWRANFEYERYLHSLVHDPLTNFPLAVPDPANPGNYRPVPGQFVAEDLNVGQDYAIRMQQLKANFQGDLSANWRWRLNLWGQRKSGERQVNSLANCFDHPQISGNDRQCHLLSQRQEIDWLTLELEPVLEGNWGPLTISYSRTLRSFNQNDQTVSRLYNSYPAIYQGQAMPPQLGSENYPAGTEYPFAVVPENMTQIDRIKLGLDLTETTHLYGFLQHGTTDNLDRDTRRDFGGFDLRLTDRTIDNLTWTAFAKLNYESNQLPATLISGEQLTFDRFDETQTPCTWSNSREYGGCGCAPVAVPCVVGQDGVPDYLASQALVQPLDYTRTTAGLNGRWVPFRTGRSWLRGLSLYGGYEFRWLHREYAQFDATLAPAVVTTYDETNTSSHRVTLGVSQKSSRTLQTFLRYKPQFIAEPLVGVRESNGVTNTNLPTLVNLVEIGGTWAPNRSFLANVTMGFENRSNHSAAADFDEQNYPLSLTAWYAATQAWSFSVGYSRDTNSIQQAITLGDDFNNGAAYTPVTRRWGYGGQHQVWSLGSTYACSPELRLRSDVQYVLGRNAIDTTVFDGLYAWPEIAELARDEIQSLRLSAGFDHRLSRCVSSYFRYNYQRFEDTLRTYNNGEAHLFLAGLSGRY